MNTNNLPTTNPYQSSENYKNDCAGAILEYTEIQPNENEIIKNRNLKE